MEHRSCLRVLDELVRASKFSDLKRSSWLALNDPGDNEGASEFNGTFTEHLVDKVDYRNLDEHLVKDLLGFPLVGTFQSRAQKPMELPQLFAMLCQSNIFFANRWKSWKAHTDALNHFLTQTLAVENQLFSQCVVSFCCSAEQIVCGEVTGH